jgi:hypothetical protein
MKKKKKKKKVMYGHKQMQMLVVVKTRTFGICYNSECFESPGSVKTFDCTKFKLTKFNWHSHILDFPA